MISAIAVLKYLNWPLAVLAAFSFSGFLELLKDAMPGNQVGGLISENNVMVGIISGAVLVPLLRIVVMRSASALLRHFMVRRFGVLKDAGDRKAG